MALSSPIVNILKPDFFFIVAPETYLQNRFITLSLQNSETYLPSESLKQVLPNPISSNHFVFITGTQITGSIFIANAIVKYLSSKLDFFFFFFNKKQLLFHKRKDTKC